MIELLRKRHDGPGWIVIEEVGNSTGYNVQRHADAIALGIWPSRGYELHGYELKASRSDVQKELADPSKADAIGGYCDFWWLVVSDLKIIDGLVIPEAWGILYPRNKVLRVHRKAPKRTDAKPVGRAFAAAMIRKVCEQWVPKHEHEAWKRDAREKARAELQQERQWKQEEMNYEHKLLKDRVDVFERAAGIRIQDGSVWQMSDLGKAVKAVLDARETAGRIPNEPAMLVRQELASLERRKQDLESAAAGLGPAIDRVKLLLERIEPPEESEKNEWASKVAKQLSLVDERRDGSA